MSVQLGDKVRDQITGFEGIVTGDVTYISGCNQLLVAPSVDDKGDFKQPQWFDEGRCVAIKSAAIKLEDVSSAARPGFDAEAPTR